MKNASLVLVPEAPSTLAVNPGRRLVDAFLAGRNARTMEAYRRDLEDFASFLDVEVPEDAARLLLAGGHGEANSKALAYRAHLLEKGLSPATVNRRLAAVRSLVKLGRVLGLVPWTLEVPSVKSVKYRDTRGPGREVVHRLLGNLEEKHTGKAKRDLALVRLLFSLGLRRGEAVALDLKDVDLKAGTVSILGKGRTEKERLTVPANAKAALESWVSVRGKEEGPLFTNYDRAGKGKRLTGRSVARVLGLLGDEVGAKVRPHGLRHSAITDALEAGMKVEEARRFSRHADLRTLMVYDDRREDVAGQVARLVDSRV